MEEDFKFIFTGEYSPLWGTIEEVKLGLWELDITIPDDTINRILYLNSNRLSSKYNISSPADWIKELVILKCQETIIEDKLAQSSQGTSITLGASYSSASESNLQKGIASKLYSIRRDIHSIVNTYLYDSYGELTKAAILSASLIEGGLDKIGMTRFFPLPNISSAKRLQSPSTSRRSTLGSAADDIMLIAQTIVRQ